MVLVFEQLPITQSVKTAAHDTKSACLEKVLYLRRFYSGVPPE